MARARFPAQAALAAILGFSALAAQAAPEAKTAESAKPSESKAGKPEPKPDPKPEAKADPKPESKVDPKPEAKAERKPEPKVDAKSEPKADEVRAQADRSPSPRPTRSPSPRPTRSPSPSAVEADRSPSPRPTRSPSPRPTRSRGLLPPNRTIPSSRQVQRRSSLSIPSQPKAPLLTRNGVSARVPWRHCRPTPEPDSTKAAKTPSADKSDKSDKAQSRTAHQKGKPPHKPSPTLPPGASRAQPDRVARQKIAEGPTDEDLRAGKDDPELRSLKAAERVLFPRPLTGVEPGWSWDLPEAVGKVGPEVITQGAPSLRPSGASRSRRWRAGRGLAEGLGNAQSADRARRVRDQVPALLPR